MIVLNVEQGSRDWIVARLGIPTASDFKRILTPGGKLSAGRTTYLNELLAEWALGVPVRDLEGLPAMERGKELEPRARAFYAALRDVDPVQVGLVYQDANRLVAASPDWMIPDLADGQSFSGGVPGSAWKHDWLRGVEVKNPLADTHIGYLRMKADGMPKAYIPQVQGQLWVTRLPLWEFMSHHPSLPPALLEVEPDPIWQRMLDDAIPTFIDEMLDARAQLRDMGVDQMDPLITMPIDYDGEEAA